MQFSEEDLRSALRRKDPGTFFTRRVMAQVSREPLVAGARRLPEAHLRRPWLLTRKPALVGAFLAVLVVVGWVSLAQYQRAQQRRAGEFAKQRAIFALRIATAKLNHVFEAAQGVAHDPSKTGGSYEEN
jgi:hypothetical protein